MALQYSRAWEMKKARGQFTTWDCYCCVVVAARALLSCRPRVAQSSGRDPRAPPSAPPAHLLYVDYCCSLLCIHRLLRCTLLGPCPAPSIVDSTCRC